MVRLSCIVMLMAVSISIPLCAQVKESGTESTSETAPIASGSPTSAVPSYSGGELTTTMNGAPAALGPGDLVDIAVFDTPELTQKIRVDSEGRLKLTLIGDIDVHGMSAHTLEAVIRSRLIEGHFVRDPQVSVFISEYAGQMAYITGEVNRPGGYSLLRSHRLADLIAVAGGLTQRAGNAITILRAGDSSRSEIVNMASGNEGQRNPEIEPGDSVTVGLAGIVYVLGDVLRPGGFLLDRRNNVSVVQSVALAEGTLPSANVRKAELIRASDGSRVELPIDFKMILKGQAPDIQMQAGDILYFPPTLFRGMGRVSIQTVLSTLSGVAIYSSYHF